MYLSDRDLRHAIRCGHLLVEPPPRGCRVVLALGALVGVVDHITSPRSGASAPGEIDRRQLFLHSSDADAPAGSRRLEDAGCNAIDGCSVRFGGFPRHFRQVSVRMAAGSNAGWSCEPLTAAVRGARFETQDRGIDHASKVPDAAGALGHWPRWIRVTHQSERCASTTAFSRPSYLQNAPTVVSFSRSKGAGIIWICRAPPPVA
jgi:hypothetical protein